ncbi:hypothetical protein AERO8C_150170 [Aeromonas veronii]|uniref:Uncharacterized protein n=1 Tax=Aeromonas veronii TaxID=654 RepID=A0A653KX49_AERVE|nr:hypothetical protein AERO8C_150170 [Aeromonas veronii]
MLICARLLWAHVPSYNGLAQVTQRLLGNQ